MKLFVDNNESKIIILSDSQVSRLSEAADKYFSSNDLEGMSSSSEVITKPRSGNRKEHETRICVGPGKSNLPFELRRKAGDCSRVTAGPIDLI